MPDRYDAPIRSDFCHCLSCRKRSKWAYGDSVDFYRNSSYVGTHEYYGTRKWNCQGRGPVWYGMELELSNCGSAAWRRAFRNLGPILAEVKPDGSLMETTTHPMSYRFFMANYPWDLLGQWESDGAVAHPDSGGIHVHVNKAGFNGADHVYNWWQLYYESPTLMTRLGGRTNPSRHFTPRPDRRAMRTLARQVAGQIELSRALHTGAVNARGRGDTKYLRPEDKAVIRETEMAVMRVRDHVYDYGRGEAGAISVRRHEPTFEVRFPGAAITKGQVATRIQLIAAGVEYTRNQEGEGDHTFASFADWVRNKRRYPELAASIAAL